MASGKRGRPASRARRAITEVSRVGFLPNEQHPYAGEDRALPIGDGVTCSQPSTVADMLELLDPRPGQRVLDVGSGSGWTSALLTVLTCPDGDVHAVEIIPRLVERSRVRLAATGFDSVEVHQAGEVLGLPEHAPYDRILVSAATTRVPPVLREQLAVGGRLVLPVADRLHIAVKTENGFTGHVAPRRYLFVPLRTPNEW